MNLPAAFTVKTMESTCVVWTGATNSKGYGLLSVDGVARLAHRIAYECANGPIPDGLVVDHLCRVRNCVKPEHLELVTVGENNRRGRSAAQLSVGDECANGHLIEEGDLYVSPNGRKAECRHCRRASKRSNGAGRPTTQRRSARVRSAVVTADRESAA